MNILFIYSRQDAQSSNKPVPNLEEVPLGISYISAVLKKHNHNTKLLVLSGKSRSDLVDKYIAEFSPTLICFSAVFAEYEFLSRVAHKIKAKYKDIILLAGGVHVSLNPQECTADAFDILCIGEGEYPMLELTQQLEQNIQPNSIANLWIKNTNSWEKNPTRQFLNDLDSLPFPDREIWHDWVTDLDARYSVLLGRGCPFNCTYCCNHALRNLASGSYVRFRSAENIVAEIKHLHRQYPHINEVYLEVETIAQKKDFVLELCQRLCDFNRTLEKPLSFGTNIRITPNIDVDSIFAAFQESNFTFVNIGLESGSQKLRTDVLKRNYSNDDVIKVVDAARTYGLKICFFDLMGIPQETLDDFKETIAINRRCQPDWYFLSIFFPYPGTYLHSLAKEQGLISENFDLGRERTQAVLNMPQFTRKQVQKSFVWFDYHVYKGHKPLYKIMARVLVNKIKTKRYLRDPYRRLTNYSVLKKLKNVLRR